MHSAFSSGMIFFDHSRLLIESILLSTVFVAVLVISSVDFNEFVLTGMFDFMIMMMVYLMPCQLIIKVRMMMIECKNIKLHIDWDIH